MTVNGVDAIGGLVVLRDLALAGELDWADGDGRAVGVELLQALGGGDDAGVVEPLLEGLLKVEHGVVVGDLNLEGERGRRPGGDRRVHGSSSSGEDWKLTEGLELSLHHSSIRRCKSPQMVSDPAVRASRLRKVERLGPTPSTGSRIRADVPLGRASTPVPRR